MGSICGPLVFASALLQEIASFASVVVDDDNDAAADAADDGIIMAALAGLLSAANGSETSDVI